MKEIDYKELKKEIIEEVTSILDMYSPEKGDDDVLMVPDEIRITSWSKGFGISNGTQDLFWSTATECWQVHGADFYEKSNKYKLIPTTFKELEIGDVFCEAEAGAVDEWVNDLESYYVKTSDNVSYHWVDVSYVGEPLLYDVSSSIGEEIVFPLYKVVKA